MDELDQRLIAALRRDGRAAVSELAHDLVVTRTTVRSRMDRLIERGEIVGFTVLTRSDAARHPVRGLMMLEIEGRGTERIIARLTTLPEIQAVHTTNGTWDLIVEIGATTLEALDAVLFAIRRLDGVTRSETSLLLSSRRPLRRGASRP